MLEKYAVDNHLQNPIFFTDDDVSSTTFEREGFQAAIALVKAGKRRRNKSGRVELFSGLAYFADCHSKMTLSSGASMKPEQDDYTCSGLRSKKTDCTSSQFYPPSRFGMVGARANPARHQIRCPV